MAIRGCSPAWLGQSWKAIEPSSRAGSSSRGPPNSSAAGSGTAVASSNSFFLDPK